MRPRKNKFKGFDEYKKVLPETAIDLFGTGGTGVSEPVIDQNQARFQTIEERVGELAKKLRDIFEPAGGKNLYSVLGDVCTKLNQLHFDQKIIENRMQDQGQSLFEIRNMTAKKDTMTADIIKKLADQRMYLNDMSNLIYKSQTILYNRINNSAYKVVKALERKPGIFARLKARLWK